MRLIMPWDVWLTRAQTEEIANGTHPDDREIAEQILTAWPDGATNARYGHCRCVYRGGPLDGYEIYLPRTDDDGA